MRARSRNSISLTGTFAPKFIHAESGSGGGGDERVHELEGEGDYSGKRYVWIKDAATAFVRAWVVQELDDERLLVQCDDGVVSMLESGV